MSAAASRIAGIAIPDSALAREATEFVGDASTRCCSAIHDEWSSGRRCGSNGTFIAPAGVTSSEASPRLTLVGGPDEVKATEARCEIRAGFRVLFEGDARITVVGEAATGEEAVAEARRLGLDLVLIDAMLPRDSVFDLSRVGRHDTGALRSIADLWPRLHGLGWAVVAAAANPTVCLNRVIPARWKLTLKPTRDEALIHLLASPV